MLISWVLFCRTALHPCPAPLHTFFYNLWWWCGRKRIPEPQFVATLVMMHDGRVFCGVTTDDFGLWTSVFLLNTTILFHFGVCSLLAPCPGFKFLHLKHASFFIKSVRSIGTFTVGLEKKTSVPCLGVLCSSILRMARAFRFVEQGAGLGHFWNSRGGSNVSEILVLLGIWTR